MPNPPTQGLVLRLEANSGVEINNGVVTAWNDLSGNGNNLNVSNGDPRFNASLTPTGASAISFDGGDDGSEDGLSRVGQLFNLPDASDDRTMFIAVQYDDVDEFAGVAYGNGADNQTFGLIATGDDAPVLAVQGFGVGNDIASETAAENNGWLVHSVVYRNGELIVYRDGVEIDRDDHVFNTVVNQFIVGESIDGRGSIDMDLAAVFLYDRALDGDERREVETYLQDTYTDGDATNEAPIVSKDDAETTNGGTVVIDILDNDFDDNNDLDISSIQIIQAPSHGTINSIDPATGAVNYTHDGLGQPDFFVYQIADGAGNLSNPISVDITVDGVTPFSLDGFNQEVILDQGLGQPISIEFLPDNRMLVIEKSGKILIVDPESGASSEYMTLTNIDSAFERGLLDITLDPDFANNGYFYLYYTPASPDRAFISRFQHNENSGGLTSTGDLSSETELWRDTDGYDACCHYGGGLDFGPDGKLWLTTADKFNTSTPGEGPGNDDLPVDLTSTSGKIIRINKDGSIPDGTDGSPANPYIDSSGDPNGNIPDSIWAYGLRNPFRARWDEEYGHLYIGEVGGNQAGLSSDSIHTASLDQAGAFYGWPFYEGTTNVIVNPGDPGELASLPQPDGDLADAANGDFYSAPIYSYDRNNGVSVTGGEVYRGDQFPEEWDGVYFFGDFTRDFIHALRLDPTGTQVVGEVRLKPTSDLPGDTPNIVYVGFGNDGALYYINFSFSGGQIGRITYEDGNAAPMVNSFTVNPPSGSGNFEYTFSANVSDAEGDNLQYTIIFGDGTQATGSPDGNGDISITHTYATDGFYPVSFSVTDGSKTTFGAPLTLEAGDPNNAPELANVDADAIFGDVGLEVTFTATATDADNDALNYVWVFGDGETANGVVGANGEITVTHTYDSAGSFDAFLQVSDAETVTTSDDITIQVGDITGVGVTDGLVLALESTIKLGLDGDIVLGWLDGSGLGNNLSAFGDPRLVQNATPSGLPALAFDGDGDYLERLNTGATPIEGLPDGTGARTFFFVVDYEDPNGVFAGFAYGDAANDEAFGLTLNGGVAATSQFTVQGYGAGNDAPSGTIASPLGFVVQSVVLDENGNFTHYIDGQVVDTGTNDFNTDIQRLVIGEEIGGAGQSALSVAAIFGYNRALGESERQQVESYLQTTYLTEPAPGDPPVAVDDLNYAVSENGVLNVAVGSGLLANDTDADGHSLTLTRINGGTVNNGDTVNLDNGTLLINSDGSFTYTPNNGFFGQETFSYVVNDGVNGDDTGSVLINVTETQSGPPEAVADAYSVEEGGTLSLNLASGFLANDSDPDQQQLTLIEINGVTVTNGQSVALDNGTLTINANGAFDYTPNAGFVGDELFTYTIQDTDNGTDTAPVLISVTRAGTPPIAQLDSYTVAQNATLTTNMANGLLANDTDAQNDPITVTKIGNTNVTNGQVVALTNGSLTINTNGTFSYTPNNGFSGIETFSYTISDGVDGETTSAAVITVSAPSQGAAPVATGDAYTVDQNTTLTVSTAQGLLGNDSDPDNDPITVVQINGSAVADGQNVNLTNGVLTINANGSLSYTPNNGFAGNELFTYAISDGNGGMASAAVLITVNDTGAPGQAPTAQADAYAVDQDQVLTVAAGQGLLANDNDPDGDPITVTRINATNVANGDTVQLTNGSLTINSDGSFSYTPTNGFNGVETFNYTVADGVDGSAVGSVSITVNDPGQQGQAPVAANDAYAVNQDTNLTVNAASGLLANDTDPDGDPITVTEINGNAVTNGQTVNLANGVLTINANGSFTFAPNAGFVGQQSFDYTVADNGDGSATASATIVVNSTTNGGLPVASGLVAHYDADENVAINANIGPDAVDGWLDGSGFGNDLFAAGDPRLLENATPGGTRAIAFDGTEDRLERDGGDNLSILPEGAEDRTVFFVVDYVASNNVFAGVSFGEGAPNQTFGLVNTANNQLGVQGWGAGNDFSSGVSSGDNQGDDEWIVQSAVLSDNVVRQFRNGVQIGQNNHVFATDISDANSTLVIGQEIAGLGEASLNVAAVLIYDRALTDVERQQVEDYLQARYLTPPAQNTAPTAVDDAYSVDEDQSLAINAANGLLANDTDAENDPLSVTQINGSNVTNGQTVDTTNGSITINADGSFNYTPDAGFFGEETINYTVADDEGGTDTGAATITVNEVTPPPSGLSVLNGLVVHLEADQNVTETGGAVTAWGDQSSTGFDLTGNAQFVANLTPTGQAAIAFDGVDDQLSRDGFANLTALPNDAEDRTVFIVVDYVDPNGVYAGVSYGDGAQNQAFGLVNTNNNRLAIQGWGPTNDVVSGTVSGDNQGADEWFIQSVVVDDNLVQHFKDGALIDSATRVFDTDTGEAGSSFVIGEEIAGLGYGELNIAAVLVYDRALDANERSAVETYLQEKYTVGSGGGAQASIVASTQSAPTNEESFDPIVEQQLFDAFGDPLHSAI